MNEKIIYLKYSTIVCEKQSVVFSWKGVNYSLFFEQTDRNSLKCFKIIRKDNNYIDISLSSWLSLYFGEDTIDPFQRPDYRFNRLRGKFFLDENLLSRFLTLAEKIPYKSYPKWRQELFRLALSYYMVAIRSGINLMPINLGLFALSIECLANSHYGKRDNYFPLGSNKFNSIINARLKRYKRSLNYRDDIKKFQKYLEHEFKLLKLFRNFYYGHSSIHLHNNKVKMTKALREWYIGSGHTKEFANTSFRVNQINNNITRDAHSLYKIGLRLNRLLFFYYIGMSREIPFATHDFRTTGETDGNTLTRTST